MKARNAVVLGATALGVAAAAVGAYRATHPADAAGPPAPNTAEHGVSLRATTCSICPRG